MTQTIETIIADWNKTEGCWCTGPGTGRPHWAWIVTFYRYGLIVAQWYITGCAEPLILAYNLGAQAGTLDDLVAALKPR